jgi:hypothetical protein
MPLRIFVDYNDYDTIDGKDRIPIYERGQEELVSQLVHHMPVIIYDWDNLEFDAVVEFNETYQSWYAFPDWSTRRDLPPISD